MEDIRKHRGGRSKAGEAAQRRAVSGHGASSSSGHHASGSNASSTDGDAALARRLQEQMDLENEQCEHDRMIAQNLLDEDMPEMLSAKAQLTEQRKRDLDRAAIREDIISRAFLCPIVQDVVCKSEGACVGMYNKRCCNHWVSEEALKEYISHQVSETLNPATVPCPQCLAERCVKCASHGQQTAAGVHVCCVPERQVRSFLSQELTLRVAKRGFEVYRQAHPGRTVKCPEPACGYWCELDTGDVREQQEANSLHLNTGEFDSSELPEGLGGPNPVNRGSAGPSNWRTGGMRVHQDDFRSDDSSEDGYMVHVGDAGASTSHAMPSNLPAIRPRNREQEQQLASYPLATETAANQGQQAVVGTGQDMFCEICSVRYCLFCSQQLGVPTRTHGAVPCRAVIKERRQLGHGRSATRKRMEAEKSQKKVRGILWQACPKCKLEAWKVSEECNMMTCKCGTKFCFLCGKDVSREGHQHFAERNSPCKDRCWHRPEGIMRGFAPCRCGAPGCDAR